MEPTANVAVSRPQGGDTRPPPVAAWPINYFTPPQSGPVQWVTVRRFPSTAQWHQARAALARSQIESLMGDGQDVATATNDCGADEGIALKVPEPQAQRAAIILEHCLSGRRWCPRCGSADLRAQPLRWYWVAWSVLFLGIAPFAPPQWECCKCRKRIY